MFRHGAKSCAAEGEDQDECTFYKNWIKHDPALLDKGLEQATLAGAYFQNRLEEIQTEYGVTFDEIRVDSSPFLRCLQTGAKTAGNLSVPINIEYRVSEALIPAYIGTLE